MCKKVLCRGGNASTRTRTSARDRTRTGVFCCWLGLSFCACVLYFRCACVQRGCAKNAAWRLRQRPNPNKRQRQSQSRGVFCCLWGSNVHECYPSATRACSVEVGAAKQSVLAATFRLLHSLLTPTVHLGAHAHVHAHAKSNQLFTHGHTHTPTHTNSSLMRTRTHAHFYCIRRRPWSSSSFPQRSLSPRHPRPSHLARGRASRTGRRRIRKRRRTHARLTPTVHSCAHAHFH